MASEIFPGRYTVPADGGEVTVFGRTTVIVSYWRSPEQLRSFAADPQSPHAGPWRAFMKDLSGSGDVGIWHETYRVAAKARECIYGDMPLVGLAKATTRVRVSPGSSTAKQRLGDGSGPRTTTAQT
ncbi:monooxygenase family protein [Arthrobacter sp. A5]|uniref:monooxygenase family protein n=1 Tax=Arthrobacter sp. A5 TaxID=576926 RepID=UPI003DA99982